jgi:4-carboxymuconolactone decarboxylase
MPPIPVDRLTEAQRKAIAQAFPGNTSPITGPYGAFLRSPQVMVGRKIVGDYLLAYKGVLPPKLTEIAILMTARHWTQQYIWNGHVKLAATAGVRPEVVQAIADGRRPGNMADDEAMIYDLCDELFRNQSISDATYARALAMIGEQGIVEAVAAIGHWASNAMMMNAVRLSLPAGVTAQLAPFPR